MSKPKENVRFIQHTDDAAVGIPPPPPISHTLIIIQFITTQVKVWCTLNHLSVT